MIRFETVNGSLYELDEEAGAWRRARPGQFVDPLQPLRGEGGPMTGHSGISVGSPVRIWGPSLTSSRDYRQIETTPVAQILEPAGDGALAWGFAPPAPMIISINITDPVVH